MIGYNPVELKSLGTEVNNAAASCAEAIELRLKEEIIDKIKDIWYAQDAVIYFSSIFKPMVDGKAEDVNNIFLKFREALQTEANLWQELTNNKDVDVTLDPYIPITINIDVSEISSADENGNIGIDIEQCNTLCSEGLDAARTILKETIDGIKSTFTAGNAFVGGSQSATADECFSQISSAIDEIFKFLSEGDASLSDVINAYKDSYIDRAAELLSDFQATDLTSSNS